MGRVENLEVRPMKTMAKVIVNPRTGSIVMNQMVTLDPGGAWIVVGGS